MDSVTVDAAVAAMEMPRPEDGCKNLQKLAWLLAEQVVNAVMDTMAEAAAEDAGDTARRRLSTPTFPTRTHQHMQCA